MLNKLIISILLSIIIISSFVSAQQSLKNIDEITSLLRENSQKYVLKYEDFLSKEITIYEECRGEYSLSFYENMKSTISEFSAEFAKKNYENSTDKEITIIILNNMTNSLDNYTASLEIISENKTKEYCDELRLGLEQIKKENQKYFNIAKITTTGTFILENAIIIIIIVVVLIVIISYIYKSYKRK